MTMQVKDVTSNQSSFMRPLVMDFSHDKKVWDLKYQYMFGKSILVAPVTEAQYTPEETEDNWLGDRNELYNQKGITSLSACRQQMVRLLDK